METVEQKHAKAMGNLQAAQATADQISLQQAAVNAEANQEPAKAMDSGAVTVHAQEEASVSLGKQTAQAALLARQEPA